MSTVALVLALLLLALAALVLRLVTTIRSDGYGTLEPPRSHPRDDGWPAAPGRFA